MNTQAIKIIDEMIGKLNYMTEGDKIQILQELKSRLFPKN